MLAGIALRAIAIQGLRAQTKPPAIVVVDINDMTDPEGLKAVTQRPDRQYGDSDGGRSLHRPQRECNCPPGDRAEAIYRHCLRQRGEGTSLVQFARAEKINEIRTKTTQSRVFMVEGM